VTASARRVAHAQPRRASIPTLDLLALLEITREETETKPADDERRVEPWPTLAKISPELIAYHKRRAHRLRSRVMRRAMLRVYRWVVGF